MAIPVHLLEAVVRHKRAGRPAGVVVRHAERHPVRDLRTHESVLLTDRGHAQSRQAGALLAGVIERVRVLHSPVERCAETARGVVDGAAAGGARAELVCAVDALGSPFILDKRRAWEIVMELGPLFIRDWFDGKLPDDVFVPRVAAAQTQLDAYAAHLERASEAVFVSHDWNIALVREDLLGVTPERTWPDFLDGIAVALDGDDVIVELDGRTGRRARSARAPAASGRDA